MFTVKFETMSGQVSTRNFPTASSIDEACDLLMAQADARVANILAVYYDGLQVM